MKLKLHENSLFAVLMRSPWWISALLAAGIFGATKLFLPVEFAAFAASPFFVIAVYGAWKALRAPSAGSIAATLERARAQSWDEFAAAIEAGFVRDGYTVKRLTAQADFELAKGPRTALVACKRWKAMRTGVEPLRELEAARERLEAHEGIYVTAGEVTEQGRAFAAQKQMRVLDGAELAKLLR